MAAKDFMGPGIGSYSNRSYIVTRGLNSGAASLTAYYDRRRDWYRSYTALWLLRIFGWG